MTSPPPLEIELLGVPVRVVAPDEELRARLALVYGASLARAAGRALEARIERGPRGFRVAVATRPERRADDPLAAERALYHDLLQALILRCRAHYFVHAAVLAWNGRALVVPGLSRSGKSTLALALVLEGARYLSDECLAFTRAGRAEPLPRALKIRDECVPYFPELRGAFCGTGEGRIVPFQALRADVLGAPVPVGAVIVPAGSSAGDDRPRRISRGEALLALVASSLNFGAHREASLDWLAEIVGDAAAYALSWRDPRVAARALLAELTPRPGDARRSP